PAAADPAGNSENPAKEWALESCRLITSASIYPAKRRITDDYLDLHRPIAELRLRQAGTRLAALINAALDPAG
ncbi:MAG: endonuclease, partial [Arenimonas sp.]|nr:endonuclease [Arenimonas sp.]